jgi:hypothetical protein
MRRKLLYNVKKVSMERYGHGKHQHSTVYTCNGFEWYRTLELRFFLVFLHDAKVFLTIFA